MQASPIDPRTIDRDDGDPRYRIYFWEPGRPHEAISQSRIGWESDEWKLTDARDIFEVLEWANEHAQGRSFQVFCDVMAGERLIAAVKLCGDDPTETDDFASFTIHST